jgi:outer membrane protein assembly factor BamB
MSGRAVPLVTLAATLAIAAAADDWPQLWGPGGDGRAAATTSMTRSATLKAREVWRRPIGSGFSGVSVVGTRGYTALSDGQKDQAIAFDTASGRELWRTPLGETYRGHDGSRDGPISTPTVEGGRVFLVGPHGLLVALDARDGRVAWSHDLPKEYGAAVPAYGFATSPLAAAGRVIVQAGGAKENYLVAFEQASGKVAWSVNPGAGATYASPVLATLHGVPQLVTVSADKVLGLSPGDGSVLWSHARPNENEPSRGPVVLPDGRVFVPSWNEGAVVAVTRDGGAFKAAELWRRPVLKNSYSPTVHHEGHLYGFNGQYLVCIDPATGDVKWRQKVYSGSLILVDGHLVVLGESSGDLRVAEATPAGYREKLKTSVFNPGATSFTGPTWAGGRVYLRNVEELVALEIGG